MWQAEQGACMAAAQCWHSVEDLHTIAVHAKFEGSNAAYCCLIVSDKWHDGCQCSCVFFFSSDAPG